MNMNNMNERTLIEQNRKRQSIKAMYFQRYLLIRYVTAMFFFTNLYWFISLIMSKSTLSIIPFMLICVIIMSTIEQIKIYNNPMLRAKYTRICFNILFISNIVLMLVSSFSQYFIQLYPFLINQNRSKIFVFIILLLGSLLSAFVLYRLDQINNNQDRQFRRIQEYEKLLK